MTLDELNNINTGDPAAVKQLQEFLKTRGYYTGPIDGKWGGGTTAGSVKLRDELKDAANVKRDTAIAEQGTAETNKEANSPLNNALRGATEFGPYAGGAALGAWAGHKGAKGMTSLWDSHAAQTKTMAGDPKVSGIAGEAKMGSMRNTRNAITGAQFLAPAALLGSAEYIRGHVAPNFEGETKKWINLGANADQGAGIGLGVHQLFDLKNRIGSPADAADEARIETRAAAERKPPAPPAPPSEPPPPAIKRPNSERLIAAAKAAGATGPLTKVKAAEYLATNVNELNRTAVAAELGVTKGQQIATVVKKLASKPGASSIAAPLVGGIAAYDAASSEAKAEGASSAEAAGKGATAAAPAAGAGYGLAKLLQKLPAGFGEASMPAAVDAMTDYQPQDLNQARNWIARNAPLAAFGAAGDARNMAQVPQRNMGKTDEFARARSLQIPQGIPAPNPDGSSPYPEMQAPMGAGPMLPQQQPPMPMRRPQLPYAAMGFGGRF